VHMFAGLYVRLCLPDDLPVAKHIRIFGNGRTGNLVACLHRRGQCAFNAVKLGPGGKGAQGDHNIVVSPELDEPASGHSASLPFPCQS